MFVPVLKDKNTFGHRHLSYAFVMRVSISFSILILAETEI